MVRKPSLDVTHLVTLMLTQGLTECSQYSSGNFLEGYRMLLLVVVKENIHN